MLAARSAQGWEAVGHAESASWLGIVGGIAPWVLLGVLALLLAHALVRRKRYRALEVLSPQDQERVSAALVAAERRTVGEIVPLVLERSDRYPGAEWCAATTLMLLGTALLAGMLPWHRPALVLLAQAGLGLVGFALARSLPGFKRLFVSAERAEEMAEEQAFQEFYRQGLHKTERATGVLIFVSLLEHQVVVLGDEGIAQEVTPELWLEVDRAVLAGVRSGALCEGLVDGIRRCGEVLAEHFPPRDGDRDEVPNRVIVRRE
jgi:putative membrane protein